MLGLADAQTSRYADYRLDGNRFVDVQHVTVQFEHGANARLLRVVEPVNDVEPVFDQLIDDAVMGPMKQLVPSERLGLWTAKLNFKHPRVGSGFGWHQDAPYWIHDGDHVEKLPNVMVMFDDAARSNGCLRVIDGSHRAGCLPGCDDGRQLAGFYTHPDAFDEEAQVPSNALPVRWCSLIRILFMGRAQYEWFAAAGDYYYLSALRLRSTEKRLDSKCRRVVYSQTLTHRSRCHPRQEWC